MAVVALAKKTPAQRLRVLKADARIVGFTAWLAGHGLPIPVAEYRFAPPRRWRFDYAWLEQKVALEEQGSLFTGGRHTRGAALLHEHEKLNAASVHGFRVLFCTPQNIRSAEMLAILNALLR